MPVRSSSSSPSANPLSLLLAAERPPPHRLRFQANRSVLPLEKLSVRLLVAVENDFLYMANILK
ncbi:hypothetical protein BS78_04G128000 [Paspalum vaginatum]|nr:hypothetical protein BS78_04G128000 [Paspalum vaginatum]